MGERMRQYLKKTRVLVDRLSEEAKEDGPEKDAFLKRVAREKAELLVQIGFFQHERLVHLIVTVLFALMTILVFFLAATKFALWTGVLLLLLLILLIPYIKHYWLLENGTQQLYQYYDKMEELYNGKH